MGINEGIGIHEECRRIQSRPRYLATTTSTGLIKQHNEHPNPHYGQNAAALLSYTYVFAAFGGHWLGAAFLILALSGGMSQGAQLEG
jgi:hypothetical protein